LYNRPVCQTLSNALDRSQNTTTTADLAMRAAQIIYIYIYIYIYSSYREKGSLIEEWVSSFSARARGRITLEGKGDGAGLVEGKCLCFTKRVCYYQVRED
jgi:hypothetical protein